MNDTRPQNLRRPRPRADTLGAALLILGTLCAGAAGTSGPDRAGKADYSEPPVLTATIYAKGSESRKVLFTFRRTAVRTNSTVRVLREFARPDGTVVARERVVFEADRLVSFQLEEPLSGAAGSIVLRAGPPDSREQMAAFEYVPKTGGAKKTGRETVRGDLLVSDMMGPFIAAHWDELMTGSTLRFRFAALARAETVGFKLMKDSESTAQGKRVVQLKMEPASWIIAQALDPLLFIVEKDAPHRVLQYTGRTTPRIQKGDKWDDLDAVTVFDWK